MQIHLTLPESLCADIDQLRAVLQCIADTCPATVAPVMQSPNQASKTGPNETRLMAMTGRKKLPKGWQDETGTSNREAGAAYYLGSPDAMARLGADTESGSDTESAGEYDGGETIDPGEIDLSAFTGGFGTIGE